MDQSPELGANSQFFDDSSAALGLNYSATTITSAHPDDGPIVPSYSPAERAELEDRRDQAARRAQELWAAQFAIEALAFSGPAAETAPDGSLIPTNDGAYAMQLADAPAAYEEPDPWITPNDPRYLGESIESLMARRVVHGSHGGKLKRKVQPVRKPITSEEKMAQYG